MKVVEGKPVPEETFFSIVAYTALEYVTMAGQIKAEDLREALTKEYPGEKGEHAIKDVFDALVDSRLIAYRPSKGTYRMSQAGKLAFVLSRCVVQAVGAGAATDDENEKNESLQ
jgi:hypothetical protein